MTPEEFLKKFDKVKAELKAARVGSETPRTDKTLDQPTVQTTRRNLQGAIRND